MTGRRFLIVMLVLLVGAGLGPAGAQDIYINRYKDRDDGSKPRVYIQRDTVRSSAKNESKRSKAFERARVRLSRDARSLKDRVEIFKSWRRSGQKPETLKEVLSYADSKRAVTEASLLKRRNNLIAYAQNLDSKKARSALARAENQKPGDALSDGTRRKTSTMTLKKDKVFVSPQDRSRAGRVFNRR